MEKKEINYDVGGVVNHFLKVLHDTNQIVTRLYHANKIHSEPVPLHETDSLPIVVGNLPEFTRDELKVESEMWLFKKAIEELIVGLTLSLIAAHKIFKAVELAKILIDNPIPELELNKKLDQIQRRPNKLPLPQLLDEIEKLSGSNLHLKNEILTMNQIRNCLVHRNGTVSSEDLNMDSQNELTLIYIDMINYAKKDGELVEMTRVLKKTPFVTKMIGFKSKETQISFKLGERVILDQNIFTGVTYTAISFLMNLHSMCMALKRNQ
ncbi:MAG: hypothetical protein IPG01_13305 [Chitinophagaceae bacterium]|nr:hypothetical protein [Chitinophagaceae bacterium]